MTTPPEPPRRRNLRRLLNPRSVALVGGRTLEPTVAMLRQGGFRGDIHIVNPTRREIAGVPCVPRPADLPQSPDAAFVAVNRHLTVEAVAGLAARGAGGAVCFAAGFGEMGAEGADLQARLLAAAGEMAVVGPNSNGLLNRLDRLALWPMQDHEPPALDRGVAIVSQSGGVAYAFLRDRRGLQPAVIVSTGNQVQIDAADWLAVLGEDPRVSAIGLFLEGPGDAAALARAAEVTRARGVPVVVLKSGRSALGAEMALTHTGAIAGEDELFSALCGRLGFIRVTTLPRMIETLKAVDCWGRLNGRRLAVLTASGAARALFADAATDSGLVLPPVSAAVAAELRPQLPEFAHVSNPLDHNAHYTGMDVLSLENEPALYACFRTMLKDDYDVAVLNAEGGEDPAGSPSLRAWIRAARDSGTPAAIVATMPDYVAPAAQRLCRAGGIAALQGVDDALAAIAAAAAAPAPVGELAILPPVPRGPSRVWDEWRSKARLEAAGVPFPPRRRVAPAGVAAAADEIGYPVVLKAVSARLAHKHRLGAVAVGLADRAALEAALARMERRLAEAGIAPDAYLVEAMVADAAAEVILGVKSSPVYGLALVVGAGGVDVERAGDAASILLPAGAEAIGRAIDGLRLAAGLPPGARDRLVALAGAIGAHAVAHHPEIVALDVNPVIVTRAGAAVAVDALIELRAEAAG